MAEINLGAIKFNWKGAYAAGTAYVVDDVVESAGSSYVCIAASTGNAPPNATYWEVMAEGGDVATVLTTQGDILYRDGSGLQRLPKGTAGQVLQMNSGATAPEYGNVSSDYVKLTTQTLGSNTTTWNLDGYFSSDYRHYVYYCDKFQVAQNGGWTRVRFNESTGTPYTGSNYNQYMTSVYTSTSTQNTNNGDNSFILVQNSTDANKYASFQLTVFDPQGATYTNAIFQSKGFDGSTNGYASHGGVTLMRTNALTGISFTDNNGGNVLAGCRVTIYGVKA